MKSKDGLEKVLKDQENELKPLPEMEPLDEGSEDEIPSRRISEL